MNNEDKIYDELLTKIDNVELIPDEELNNMNFYELAYYMQTLNQIDDLSNDNESEDE